MSRPGWNNDPWEMVGESLLQGAQDGAVDLIATGPDGRADPYQHVIGLGAKGLPHGLERFGGHTGHSAAPSRVGGSYRSLDGVPEQDGHTIGRDDEKRKPRLQSNNRVSLFRERGALDNPAPAIASGCLHHAVPMDLEQGNSIPESQPQAFQQP